MNTIPGALSGVRRMNTNGLLHDSKTILSIKQPIFQLQALSTHWGQVTHICISKLPILGSDNGLSPGRHQAIISTNAGILLIWPLGTNFSEVLIEINTFSFKKMHLKMSSVQWRPFCLGLNVLRSYYKTWYHLVKGGAVVDRHTQCIPLSDTV